MTDQAAAPENLLEDRLGRAILEQALTCHPLARIGRYFSGIIHNLNGCLQNTQMQYELLDLSLRSLPDSQDNQKAEFYLRQLGTELDHLSEMLRFWGEQVDLEEVSTQEWFDVNQVLHRTLTVMEADPLYKLQVSTELRLQQDLPQVYGNISALNHAVGALLENAVDSMHDSKERRLVLATSKQADHVQVMIEDSGCSLPEELLEAVRSDGAKDQEGLVTLLGLRGHRGLGLYLAHHTIASFGGSIRWQSRPGKTVCSLKLPISPKSA